MLNGTISCVRKIGTNFRTGIGNCSFIFPLLLFSFWRAHTPYSQSQSHLRTLCTTTISLHMDLVSSIVRSSYSVRWAAISADFEHFIFRWKIERSFSDYYYFIFILFQIVKYLLNTMRTRQGNGIAVDLRVCPLDVCEWVCVLRIACRSFIGSSRLCNILNYNNKPLKLMPQNQWEKEGRRERGRERKRRKQANSEY